MLRRIFEPKRVEVTGEWRKLHNEELLHLYSSPNIVWFIKSRRMRWAWHVARLGRREACIGFWWGNLRERDHWGDPGLDWKIILEWIFRMWNVEGMDWIGLAQDGDRLRAFVNAVMNIRVQ
jgi:hypothetical protein